ncbi:NRPS condensation (elongation) domain-containing protein [Levilactobacillus senmaizukei DSM 21775 = NBRC 103853]|uniref:NRPS condensation (Elongation) domain-containing protein n=1 Tax=Levilactobacillus senmaizukei DSM 21775 = NBRC 103853 TaxID=1423803 RepID=A0A0R2DFE2_9LACO|nr:condensation domain-containing protein [Levilactobacillus senmaizukei]KRN02706.1 NRPS condensation (elongation) domain-containing protein [Levilactobacillus senmaizukei DSM 21775 = NBRC 103853]
MIYHGEPLDLLATLDPIQTYPLLECTLSLTQPIDVARLKAAVATTQTVVPQVLGRYNLKRNRFEVDRDTLDQVISEYSESHDPGRAQFDVEVGPQLKIQVIHYDTYDQIRLVMSSLLTDGEGFKHYLYLLAAAYSGEDLTNFTNERGTRKILQHLRHPHRPLPTMNERTAEKVPAQRGDIHHHRGEAIISQVISRRMRQKAHFQGVTMNAVLLSAYALSLSAVTGERQLVIPVQVDLRLHGPVSAANVVQVANMTSEMPLKIEIGDGDTLQEVVQRTQATISDLRDRLAYLPPLVEVNRMSRALPPIIVRRLAGKFKPQAPISFANFGHIDHTRLDFAGIAVTQIYFAGAYRTMPHFQLTVSIYHDTWTLAFRMMGSEPDYQLGIKILKNVVAQLTQWSQHD